MVDAWDEQRSRLARAYADFLDTVGALSPEVRERPGACGEWSAKDVVSHSSGWDEEAVARLVAIRDDPGLPDRSYDVERFNASAVSARRPLSWDAALAELQETHRRLAALLASVTPEEARRDPRFGEWAEGRATDFAFHAAQLREWSRGH